MNLTRLGGRSRRSGVAISVVMGLVCLLVAALFPMLFFSGSQTRSMAVEGEDWRSRHMARAGLAVAAERLRVERWYGDDSVLGSVDSEEVGLAGPDRFHVVCEDTLIYSPDSISGFETFPLVHHIDVFARGEAEGRAVVAYGAFIMNPAPELQGRSTDGLDGEIRETTSDTLKRLVRVAYFRDEDLQDIDRGSVRDAIRARIREKTQLYLPNYLQVDWATQRDPPEAPAPRLSEGEAQAFLDRFRWDNPADPESLFLRDRIFDMLLEGTPAQQRRIADRLRTVSIRSDEDGEDLRAEAQFFCELDSDCEWGPFPPQEEMTMLPPDALGILHEIRDGTPDAGYRERLAAHDCARLFYEWGAENTERVEEVSEGALQGLYPGSAYAEWDGVWWVDYWARKDENPCVAASYQLDDPASGLDLELDDVYGFFRKYFELEIAAPLGEAGIDKTSLEGMGYAVGPLLLDVDPLAALAQAAEGGDGREVSRRAAF